MDMKPLEDKRETSDDRLIRLAWSGCLACCSSMAISIALPLLGGAELVPGGLAVSAAATAGVFALATAITRFERRAMITNGAKSR